MQQSPKPADWPHLHALTSALLEPTCGRPNDSGGGTESTNDGKRVDPLASLERLLRRLRLERPNTTPLILYVCAPPRMVPRSFHKCEGLYRDVVGEWV